MNHPKIGIRPTIDGRRGPLKVRESLEEQTMNMARAAAKLFTDNLRYSDGTPVEVVIADTTIGRVPEAAACAEKKAMNLGLKAVETGAEIADKVAAEADKVAGKAKEKWEK